MLKHGKKNAKTQHIYDLKFTQLNFSNSCFQRITKRNFQWRKPHTRENLSETCRLVNKYPEREMIHVNLNETDGI